MRVGGWRHVVNVRDFHSGVDSEEISVTERLPSERLRERRAGSHAEMGRELLRST